MNKKQVAGLSINTTSMKWQSLFRLTGMEENRNIFITTRYIGKGIVCGDTRGSFEVHKKGKVAEHIYLVA